MTLAKRAKLKGDEQEAEEVKRRRKKRQADDDEGALRRKKARRVDDESSSVSGDSSGSEPVFQKASTREVDLVAMSKKNPGCLLKSALKEMSRYLSARGEASGRWKLGGRKAHGADSRASVAEHPGRTERGRKGRASSPEAASAAATHQHIGTRRREGSKASRDAIGQASEAKGSVGVSSSQGDFQQSSKRDREEPVEGRKPKSHARASDPDRGRGQATSSEVGSCSEVESSGFVYSSDEGEAAGRNPRSESPRRAVEQMEVQEKEEVRRFAHYCSGLEVGGKSLSQVSGLMVRVLQQCPGVVGRYATALIDGTAPPGTGRIRDVLPLPIDDSIRSTLEQLPENGAFKVKGGKLSGGMIKASYRKVGIDCLTYCMVVALNLLWGGLGQSARLPAGVPNGHQKEVLERLRRAAAYSLDSKDGVEKGGVPRAPKEDWPSKLKDSHFLQRRGHSQG